MFRYFPNIWKGATIFPILKPGKPANEAMSYRPISLLNIISKLFERLLLRRVVLHIEDNNILPNEQFGFRRAHSTSHQILRIVKHVRSRFCVGESTGFLAFDIEKAFDKVWHEGIIFKLNGFNFPKYLTSIISSFLSDRSFRVRVGNDLSDPLPIKFGVPHGAVLSPVLYNIFTADIPVPPNCRLATFADDTVVMTSSKFHKRIRFRLEIAAKKLFRYFHKWKIMLNDEKTEAIFFTRRKFKQKPNSRDRIKIGSNLLPWKNCIKYLGCHLDPRLTLKEHISKSIAKSIYSLKCLYPLIHRRSTLSRKLKNNMYKMYFRPILTYPIIVLHHTSKTNLLRVQVQQYKLLKILNNKPWDYSTKLLHTESKVPLITELITRCYERAGCQS